MTVRQIMLPADAEARQQVPSIVLDKSITWQREGGAYQQA